MSKLDEEHWITVLLFDEHGNPLVIKEPPKRPKKALIGFINYHEVSINENKKINVSVSSENKR